MNENELPAITRLLSKIPLGPSTEEPLVDVCAAVSSFIHVTVSPTSILISNGMKHELVSSHPGTDEPGALNTCPSEGTGVGVGIGVGSGSGSGSGMVMGPWASWTRRPAPVPICA